MRDRFPLLLAAGLLLLGFLGATLMRGAARGEFADRLSTYRSEEHGARALFLLAEESGLAVARHKADLRIIDEGSTIVLLGINSSLRIDQDDVIDPAAFSADDEAADAGAADAGTADAGTTSDGGVASSGTPHTAGEPDEAVEEGLVELANRLRALEVDPEEREELLEHVKAGHTLIYAPWHRREDPLLAAVGIWPHPPAAQPKLRTLVPAQPAPHTLGAQRVEAEVRSFLDLGEEAIPLLLDELTGEAVAAVTPYGRGQVVVLGAPELAMNRALVRADNAQLWLSLLRAAGGEGPILFDEFHHGFRGDRSIAEFAARYGLHLAIGQLILGLCLWALSLRRFGRPRAPAQEDRVGSAEALSATSRLYREGRHHAFAAGLIAAGLTQELAAVAGRPPHATLAEVGAGLRSRGRADLAAALVEVDGLARTARSDEDVEQTARVASRARALLARRRAAQEREIESGPPTSR